MVLPAQEPPVPLIVEHRARSSVRMMNVIGLICAGDSGELADFTRQRSGPGKDILTMLAGFRLGHLAERGAFHRKIQVVTPKLMTATITNISQKALRLSSLS